MPQFDTRRQEPLDIAIVGLRHPHAVRGHEPLSWLDTLRYSPGFRVAAACDASAAGRELMTQHLPGTPLYRDVASMLAAHPTIRAALVFLPNDEMAPTLAQLVEAKVHVAVDKPGARTSKELRAVAAIANENRLVTAVAYIWRMKPLVKELQDLVSGGALGKVWSVESRLITRNVAVRGATNLLFSKERSGGGILHWLGCHWLDLIRFVTRTEIESVVALTANVSNSEIDVEDVAMLAMELEGGAVANLVAGYLLPNGSHSDMAVRGAAGWADANFSRSTLASITEAGSRTTRPAEQPGSGAAVDGYGGQAAVDFLHAFGQAVRRQEWPPDDHAATASTTSTGRQAAPGASSDFATFEDAVRVLAVIEAAYTSAQERCAVRPAYVRSR